MKPMNLANVLFSLKSLKKKICDNNNKKETETRYVFIIINGNTTPKPICDNHHHSFIKTNTFVATAKVVNTVSVPVPIWSLEWYISVPVNTGVSFRVYRYIYIYLFICLFIKIYNLLRIFQIISTYQS